MKARTRRSGPRAHVPREAARDAAGTRPARRRIAPWLVAGSGVALAIGGGILIALDEDEVQRGTVSPSYRDTATGGVVLATTGALAVAVGGVWLAKARKKPTRTPAVAPVVTYQGGARFGIVGRF